ncbi:hypothetical protein B0H11DRAFT_1981744 [Mycena galericulata]|nr:hypothetical protein B0H11DRAFT_1981744 [Mycena galericulata]
MLATILDLPPEITFRILELTLSVSTYDMRHYCTPEAEYQYLQTMAFVHTSWVAPSQILLWRYVSLHNALHVRRWVNSPAAGRYTTLGMSIYGRDMSGDVLTCVLSKTVGLQTLELAFFEPISLATLALPQLRDLTALVLRYSTVVPRLVTDDMEDLSLRLRFFQTMHTHIDAPVISALFRSSADTLECLELEQQNAKDSPTLLGLDVSFPLVAHTIRTLRIAKAYAFLVPRLAACTALRQLELARDIDASLATAIFKVLPMSLEDLYLGVGTDHGMTLLNGTVRALSFRGLASLKRLHLPHGTMFNGLSDRRMGLPEAKREIESVRTILMAHNVSVLAIPRYI